MKHTLFALSILTLALLAPGCAVEQDSADDESAADEETNTSEAAISTQSLVCTKDKDDFRHTGVMQGRLEFDRVQGGIRVWGVTLSIQNPEGRGGNKLFVTPPGGGEQRISNSIAHNQTSTFRISPVIVRTGQSFKIRMVSNQQFAFDWSCTRSWRV